MVGETEEDDEEEDEPPPKKVAPPLKMPTPGYGEEVFEQFALDGAPLEEEGEEEEHEEDDPPVVPMEPFEVDVPSPTTPEEAAPWPIGQLASSDPPLMVLSFSPYWYPQFHQRENAKIQLQGQNLAGGHPVHQNLIGNAKK